jgi:hypothetical protein
MKEGFYNLENDTFQQIGLARSSHRDSPITDEATGDAESEVDGKRANGKMEWKHSPIIKFL